MLYLSLVHEKELCYHSNISQIVTTFYCLTSYNLSLLQHQLIRTIMEEYESIFLSLDKENSGQIDIELLKKSVEEAKVPSINDVTQEGQGGGNKNGDKIIWVSMSPIQYDYSQHQWDSASVDYWYSSEQIYKILSATAAPTQ